MWTTLEIDRPGLMGDQGRAAIAKINDHTNRLPPAFFHYDGEAGRAISDRPSPIRISANGKKVFVTGIGREGRDMLYDHAVDIVTLFREDDPGWRVGFRLREGDLRAKTIPYDRKYRLHRFATRRIKRADREKGLDHPDVLAKLRQIVEHALREELEAQGLPTPNPGVSEVKVIRTIPVVHHGRLFPTFELEASIRADLKGPWAIGALKANGYGRITPVRGNRENTDNTEVTHADAE